jgi:hypothetical protein
VVSGCGGKAAKRKIWPARFFTVRTPRQSSCPPLMSLSGQRASQETKFAAVGHFDISRPTSLNSDKAFSSKPDLRTETYKLFGVDVTQIPRIQD